MTRVTVRVRVKVIRVRVIEGVRRLGEDEVRLKLMEAWDLPCSFSVV